MIPDQKETRSMKKNELYHRLKNEKIPENCYCLHKADPDDCFVLNQQEGMWHVYYTERGHIYEEIIFDNEDSACDYFYHRIKKMLSSS